MEEVILCQTFAEPASLRKANCLVRTASTQKTPCSKKSNPHGEALREGERNNTHTGAHWRKMSAKKSLRTVHSPATLAIKLIS